MSEHEQQIRDYLRYVGDAAGEAPAFEVAYQRS